MRRRALLVAASLSPLAMARLARAAGVLKVAYAGSMGVVMDKGLGPAFAAANEAQFQGTGQGAYGFARLLAAKKLQTDVFVSVTPGPVAILLKAGLLKQAMPIASTAMVIAYSPKSQYAAQFKATDEKHPWWQVMRAPGFRFGRTDPMTDPQGRNIIFTMELAEIYYRVPGLARHLLGTVNNPAQVFTEPSLLSRLEGGQLDATSGYQSGVVSHKLPYVALPPEINLSDPADAAKWYSQATFLLPAANGGTTEVHPEPLVFYAGVLEDAPSPDLGRKFVELLTAPQGQQILKQHGYGPPKGSVLG